MLWTVAFWKGLGERAIKTAAQALVAAIGTVSMGAIGIFDVSWNAVVSMAALTTLLSILTSIGNADFTAGTLPRRALEDPDIFREDGSVV